MHKAETVPYVDATFGGRRLRFQLERDRETIDKLEAVVGSVSACWGRFRSGDWTMSDLRTVLALAHPPVPPSGVPERPRLRSLASVMREVKGLPPIPEPVRRGVDVDVIDRQILSRPLATYANLGGLIIFTAFTGLPPDEAVFDEDAPILEKKEQAA